MTLEPVDGSTVTEAKGMGTDEYDEFIRHWLARRADLMRAWFADPAYRAALHAHDERAPTHE